MKYIITCIIFLANFSLLSAQQSTKLAETRIMVRFKTAPKIPVQNPESGYFSFGIQAIDSLNKLNSCFIAEPMNKAKTMYVLRFKTRGDVQKMIQDYMKTGLLKYAEPDFIGKSDGSQGNSITPNDPNFNKQWALSNDGSFNLGNVKAGADINMKAGWAIQQGSSKTVIAVLDGGCKLNHPELTNRFWINPKEIPNNGKDDDSDGFIDNINGWDFAYDDKDPSDDVGHGTNVCGIIAANGNNNFGVAGINWHARLMVCKVLDNTGYGYYSWWVKAINYSVDHGAFVINMSLAGASFSQALQDATDYADSYSVCIIASMGNDNSNALNYPAANPTVIAVGATDADDKRSTPFFWSTSSGSNYGKNISVVAPGNYIYGLSYTDDSDYTTYWGGTSQAAPHVTGLASLLYAQNPNYTPQDIRRIIQNTADDQVGDPSEDVKGWDQYYGYGRINAGRALAQSAGIESEKIINSVPLYVFPNPSSDLIRINYALNQIEKPVLSLYNIEGKLIESHTLGTQSPGNYTQQLNPKLSPGIYMLIMKGNNFTSQPVKLVRY